MDSSNALPEMGRLGSFPRMLAAGDDNNLFPYIEVAYFACAR
jgi:hypothetical protein